VPNLGDFVDPRGSAHIALTVLRSAQPPENGRPPPFVSRDPGTSNPFGSM